jgi:hypothetical protein
MRQIAVTHIPKKQELVRFLLPVMEAELEHEANPGLIRRHRNVDLREHCGKCQTSVLFSAAVYVWLTGDGLHGRLLLDVTFLLRLDVPPLWVGIMWPMPRFHN